MATMPSERSRLQQGFCRSHWAQHNGPMTRAALAPKDARALAISLGCRQVQGQVEAHHPTAPALINNEVIDLSQCCFHSLQAKSANNRLRTYNTRAMQCRQTIRRTNTCDIAKQHAMQLSQQLSLMAANSMERGDSDFYQVNERASFFFDLRGTAPATTTGEAPSNGSSSVTNFNSHFWSCCLAAPISNPKQNNIEST